MKTRGLASDPEILGGRVCFKGTRVPYYTLTNYMTKGYTLDEFLAHFPTVDRADAIDALTGIPPFESNSRY